MQWRAIVGLRTFIEHIFHRGVYRMEIQRMNCFCCTGLMICCWSGFFPRTETLLRATGKRYSNRRINKLYSLNRFYNGSLQLLKESTTERHKLVALALLWNGLASFQFIALLRAQDTDILCEVVRDANSWE